MVSILNSFLYFTPQESNRTDAWVTALDFEKTQKRLYFKKLVVTRCGSGKLFVSLNSPSSTAQSQIRLDMFALFDPHSIKIQLLTFTLFARSFYAYPVGANSVRPFGDNANIAGEHSSPLPGMRRFRASVTVGKKFKKKSNTRAELRVASYCGTRIRT